MRFMSAANKPLHGEPLLRLDVGLCWWLLRPRLRGQQMTRNIIIALALVFLILLFLYPFANARAQTNHDRHHSHYQNWTNQQDKGCCNNNDCGELAEQDERAGRGGGIEVRVEGEWCPVQAFHYLKRGNAPNWATSHVCVLKKFDGYTQNNASVCDRLLCYQPKPGI
jgi:hypothetical protein